MFNLMKKNGVKERILKNNEALFDVVSKKIQSKACPFMMGQKCIGELCEHFMEFKYLNRETGKETPYWRCAHTQTPALLIELNRNIRELKEAVDASNAAKKG